MRSQVAIGQRKAPELEDIGQGRRETGKPVQDTAILKDQHQHVQDAFTVSDSTISHPKYGCSDSANPSHSCELAPRQASYRSHWGTHRYSRIEKCEGAGESTGRMP